jgi:hypothetical protein
MASGLPGRARADHAGGLERDHRNQVDSEVWFARREPGSAVTGRAPNRILMVSCDLVLYSEHG